MGEKGIEKSIVSVRMIFLSLDPTSFSDRQRFI